MSKHSKMTIENQSWTIEQLLSRQSIINKPKFQRDQKWKILPAYKTNNNTNTKTNPNYKDYIIFLIENKNSVYPISLGTEIKDDKENYIVIDGNNRINAIITFLNKPYTIFPEYYDNLKQIINSSKDNILIKEQYIKIILDLNYTTIANFRRLSDIVAHNAAHNSISNELFRQIDDELINIQKKFLYKINEPFNINITLNVNIFKNGSGEEYCKIFEDINKHANSLSENELLSAILFTTNITINDTKFKNKLIDNIKEFYDNRGQNEVLEQYKMKLDYEININAFDFIIGFQNYCSYQYSAIHKFDPEGLSLFFKLFRYLYGSIHKDNFTRENVNKFIEEVECACKILNSAYNDIFQENIDENIFNKSAIKNKLLIKKNPMVIILISNIANKHIDAKKLINDNKKCIVYHLLSNKKYLKGIKDDEFVVIKDQDSIEYASGGGFIDNLCMSILTKDKNKIFNISKEKFNNLLLNNIKFSIDEKTHENERKTNKRRKLNLLDKILISNYWNRHMPNKLLKERYSIEHITPYSSLWKTGEIDIDRLGNIFPTLVEINTKRGNKPVTIYKDEFPDFYEFVKPLLQLDEYPKINLYENRKSEIKSIETFNNVCNKNEKLYISNLIHELYS